MGWWKIRTIESGQVDKIHVCPTNPNFVNAVPGEEKEDAFYNGDEPADIMGKALKKIRECYQTAWKREEKPEEMSAVFNFCYNPMKKV